MVDDNSEYLVNYKADTLYTSPAKNGAYATIVGNSEDVIAEIDVTSRARLAVSAFYVNDHADFSTLKITKIKLHKTRGWLVDGHVHLNGFQVAQMKEFLSVLSSLDLRDTSKTRVSLGNIQV